jgi:hypothetical protein
MERERRGNVGMEVEEREKQRKAGNAPLPAAAPAGRRACRQLRHARRRACRLFAGGLVMEHGDELGNGDGAREVNDIKRVEINWISRAQAACQGLARNGCDGDTFRTDECSGSCGSLGPNSMDADAHH